jgi:hypothetical protein
VQCAIDAAIYNPTCLEFFDTANKQDYFRKKVNQFYVELLLSAVSTYIATYKRKKNHLHLFNQICTETVDLQHV